jgi:hypothetical protein
MSERIQGWIQARYKNGCEIRWKSGYQSGCKMGQEKYKRAIERVWEVSMWDGEGGSSRRG